MQEKRKSRTHTTQQDTLSLIPCTHKSGVRVSDFSRTGDGKEITANHYHHSTYLLKD